ncbi:MAG: inositol monophosphatase family protein [Chloroflexota bacterium]
MHEDGQLECVIECAREAGDIVLSYFHRDRMQTRDKGERDVVTDADFASEKFIRTRLRELFPDDGIVGEEGTAVESSGSRTWYIDPLDGTLNYSHGVPMFGVSISLFQGSEPVLGVVFDPLRDEMFAAARDSGATCNGIPIHCAKVKELSAALVHLTIDFKDEAMRDGLRDIQLIAPAVLRTRNLGSAALALCYVAAGRLDGMLHRHAYPWDYGAGVVLIREAGGVVTELDGSGFTVVSETVLAGANESIRAGLEALVN